MVDHNYVVFSFGCIRSVLAWHSGQVRRNFICLLSITNGEREKTYCNRWYSIITPFKLFESNKMPFDECGPIVSCALYENVNVNENNKIHGDDITTICQIGTYWQLLFVPFLVVAHQPISVLYSVSHVMFTLKIYVVFGSINSHRSTWRLSKFKPTDITSRHFLLVFAFWKLLLQYSRLILL